MLSKSKNTSSSESLPGCTLQYILCLLHIILKFAILSWQVPRSSVGRALYRESGPSQDGDPDPGNLPFFLLLFHFLFQFFYFLFSDDFLIFYQACKQSEVFLFTRLFTTLHWERFTDTLVSLPFSYSLRLSIDIGTLLKFNVIKSSN